MNCVLFSPQQGIHLFRRGIIEWRPGNALANIYNVYVIVRPISFEQWRATLCEKLLDGEFLPSFGLVGSDANIRRVFSSQTTRIAEPCQHVHESPARN